MDPNTFISGVAAVITAIQTWIQFRDSERAAEAFENRRSEALNDPAIRNEASTLASLVPGDVLETMGQRARNCWEKYHNVLNGGFLPDEIDEATESVKKCICRELRRIKGLNGYIPEGQLSEWWNAYCASSFGSTIRDDE